MPDAPRIAAFQRDSNHLPTGPVGDEQSTTYWRKAMYGDTANMPRATEATTNGATGNFWSRAPGQSKLAYISGQRPMALKTAIKSGGTVKSKGLEMILLRSSLSSAWLAAS